ncbi:uncharacterized protein LOC144627623 [Crassostrea virginica]
MASDENMSFEETVKPKSCKAKSLGLHVPHQSNQRSEVEVISLETADSESSDQDA